MLFMRPRTVQRGQPLLLRSHQAAFGLLLGVKCAPGSRRCPPCSRSNTYLLTGNVFSDSNGSPAVITSPDWDCSLQFR